MRPLAPPSNGDADADDDDDAVDDDDGAHVKTARLSSCFLVLVAELPSFRAPCFRVVVAVVAAAAGDVVVDFFIGDDDDDAGLPVDECLSRTPMTTDLVAGGTEVIGCDTFAGVDDLVASLTLSTVVALLLKFGCDAVADDDDLAVEAVIDEDAMPKAVVSAVMVAVVFVLVVELFILSDMLH